MKPWMLLGLAACAGGAPGEEAVAVQAAPTTLRLELFGDMDFVDPAAAYTTTSWQMEYATCAKLLNYADVGGQVQLVPEIAAQLPRVLADGTQYTFAVRGNFRFAPSGAVVTAADVKRTFERATDPTFFGADGAGPAAFFMHDVVAIDLLPDSQIRFTLAGPSGDFMHRVAMNFFCVVPASYPAGPQAQPPPTAGPYYVSSYTPAHFDSHGFPTASGEIVLQRNPGYHGKRPAGFDTIHYLTGSPPSPDEVIAGDIDYLPEGVGPDPDLLAAYGPGTSPQRLFVDPLMGIRYLAINSVRVTDVNVRKAINFAVDRAAVAAVTGDTVNDDYLPPGIAGYQGTHPYLVADGVAQALSLLGGAQPSLIMYAPNRRFQLRIADAVAASLAAAGIHVAIVPIPPGPSYFSTIANPNAAFDIALAGWIADYPDPFDFLNTLLSSDSPNDFAHFSGFNDALANAATTLGAARTAVYGQLDLQLMAASPIAVLGNFASYDFFSAHVGCQVFQPMLGIDLAALCPR